MHVRDGHRPGRGRPGRGSGPRSPGRRGARRLRLRHGRGGDRPERRGRGRGDRPGPHRRPRPARLLQPGHLRRRPPRPGRHRPRRPRPGAPGRGHRAGGRRDDLGGPQPARRHRPRGGPRPGSPGTGGLRAALRVWREPRTLAIGAIALGMALAEGTANDWLPLIAVDGYDLSSASGAFLYSFFGASMAVGRFAGGTLLDRFGRTRVMVASAGLAVVGIGLVSLAPNVPLGALGVFLWGLGASLGFPVALSAAGDDPVDSARRVSAVATAGYTAFLVGPPLLGFVGEHVGLRSAILVALVLVALSSLFARSVDKPQPA
ncbi:MFS transporter [Actinosynnema sp.]|uniref:MFS transporter n=1 Tax=Actinosynnema sp. TaxID=1872144 RepID=UPI003F836B38